MNIEYIDLYDAPGNSLLNINNNFQIFNIQLCNLEKISNTLNNTFSLIQSISPNFNSFITTVNTLSGRLFDVGTLIHNLEGYWLEPINLMYQNTFYVVANFAEIATWLDNTFSYTTFAPQQILTVSFIVQNYNPYVLDNTPLPNITTNTLNSLAASYNVSTLDIQNTLSYINIIDNTIAVINNVINQNGQTQLIIGSQDTNTAINYYNSFTILNNILSSSIFNNAIFSQNDLQLIYSSLYQINLINPVFQTVNNLVSGIPHSITNQFNINGIQEMYIGSYCFQLNNSNNWAYVPTCGINFCVDNICSPCFKVIDVNSLYSGKFCPLPLNYELIQCPPLL